MSAGRRRSIVPGSDGRVPLPRDDRRRCARCRAFLSRYASHGDRFCIVCNPALERRPRMCAAGHDLELYGVANGGGRVRCGRCLAATRKAA